MNSKSKLHSFEKTFISFILVFVMLCSLVSVSAVIPAEGIYIYVSVENGSDDNPGTLDKPLKTIVAARDMAREYAGQEVHVVFRGGTYRYFETVHFEAADSGTAENPIIYEAYEDEKVDFKASVELDETKAQPVTDEAIRERMYEHVRDKVVVIDLAEQGIVKSQICDTSYVNGHYGLIQTPVNCENNAIYINDKEQSLAHWPNDNHYAHSPKSLTNQTMFYSEDEPGRWLQAKDFWIGCWPNYDFQYSRMSVKSIDPVQKTLTVLDNQVLPLSSHMSRRWAAFNLLEEIDIPGEYYIDRENMKLYLYPPYSLKDVKLEMSILENPILRFTNAKNITVKGINFSQTRGTAVWFTDVDNIDIIECVFRDISYNAISGTGTQSAITNQNHWHKMKTNASYRVNIKSCDFYNIGSSAINLNGGDVDTLTNSENIIEDCFFWAISQKTWWDVIEVRGCGTVVRNNNLTNARKQAIYPWGNNHLIEYNEIYDVTRETGDAGTIYWGGDVIYRGSMVQYNYIHDCEPIEKTGAATFGVYWDDTQSGMSAQYNIFKGLTGDFNSNGAGATLHQYNTSIDCDKTLSMYAHPYRATDIVTQNVYGGTVQQAVNDVYDKELFFKAYPDLAELEKGVNPKKFTKVVGNLAVDCGPYAISDEDKHFATIEDNQSITGKEVFVDPDNQDWRLKSDSELAKANPNLLNDSNFDMDSIGMKREFVLNEETAPFRMLYPKNGTSAVSTKNTEFVWDKAYGANKYRLVVATDRELTNRVYDEIVSYNDISLTTLEKGKTYFWTVYAVNSSREFGNEWQAQTGVYSFSTALYNPIDVSAASHVVSAMDAKLDGLKESNDPGDFKIGSRKVFEEYLNLTKFLIQKQPVGLTEEKLGEYSTFLSEYFSNPELVNQGFVDVSKYFQPDGWDMVDVTDDAVTLLLEEDGSGYAGSNNLESVSENVVFCFDAEFNLKQDGFMTFGLSSKASTHQYQKSNPGNYIVIKHGLLELQRQDGSGAVIVDTKDINLCDGKKHSFKMGRLRLDIGNYFIVEIDGELVFAQAAVDGTEIASSMQIVFAAYNKGDMIRLTKYSGEIPDAASYDELKVKGTYQGAKAIQDNFKQNYENPALLNLESNRFITETGVYEMTHKPVLEGNDEVFVTEDVLEKLLGCEAEVSSSAAKLITSDASYDVAAKIVDGIVMISLKNACNALGKSFTYDWENYNAIVADSGALVVNNEQNRLKKVTAILKVMETLPVVEFADVIK